MYVEVCSYCGKVRQIGRGVRAGGKTYCCQGHANRDNAAMMMQTSGVPSGKIKKRGGSGYWTLEDGGYWLLEDGGKWVMEDYS